VTAYQPKALAGQRRVGPLASLLLGLLLGALGSLPAWFGGRDSFALLAWLACVAPASGAFLGALGVDPLRFAAVAPALWAVALALLGASEEQAQLPTPVWGALAWTGLFFGGLGLGRLARAPATSAAALLLLCALLIGLPGRGGLAGEPWPGRAASVLLDLSPFVLLGECSGARDLAWHRSLYSAAGTDRFQRAPWDPPWTGSLLLALGLGWAVFADRRAQAAAARAGG